jgi:hypothetical protein
MRSAHRHHAGPSVHAGLSNVTLMSRPALALLVVSMGISSQSATELPFSENGR